MNDHRISNWTAGSKPAQKKMSLQVLSSEEFGSEKEKGFQKTASSNCRGYREAAEAEKSWRLRERRNWRGGRVKKKLQIYFKGGKKLQGGVHSIFWPTGGTEYVRAGAEETRTLPEKGVTETTNEG